MLDFRIATFLKLCETGSYTRTAQLLDITQPSVTQHIKYLQKQYQCRLFIYEGKKLRLTPQGEYLRRQAESMMRMSSAVAADLRHMTEHQPALRFGVPSELGVQKAARITAQIMREPEQPEVSVASGSTEALLRQLEDGSLDFILADQYYQRPHLSAEAAYHDTLGCYVSAERTALPQNSKSLLQERLFLREEGASDRAVLQQLLSKKGLALNDFFQTLQCNTTSAIAEMTAGDAGICFGYASALETVGQRIRRLPLKGVTSERCIVFLSRKNSVAEEQLTAFFRLFREEWEALDTETKA